MFFRPHFVQSMIAQIQTIRKALVKWCYPKKTKRRFVRRRRVWNFYLKPITFEKIWVNNLIRTIRTKSKPFKSSIYYVFVVRNSTYLRWNCVLTMKYTVFLWQSFQQTSYAEEKKRFKILGKGMKMWPVKMTGEVKKWTVKRQFWPVIVRWPAVILSPGLLAW